jgi:threonine aldolase
MAADCVGKEAAIFVPSGTMANQTAIRALTHHGDVVLAGAGAHIVRYESGAAAALSGIQIQAIGSGGFFDADDVRNALVPSDHHYAPIGLIAIENTHNTAGGRIFPYEEIVRIAETAHEHGIPLHLDGARLFNAVVASGIAAPRWTRHFDTVSFCLSKGLGAPIGSLVCGSADVIDRVHRYRKMFGGGMRQAGLLAAAGIYALEHHVDRLAEDHANARRLADGLTTLGIEVDPAPETNILLFRPPDAEQFFSEILQRGILLNPPSGGRFRAVLHLDVTRADVDEALGRIAQIVG